ncbi:MAG TPA: hypothetical protein VK892_07085 [Pyrinomonadaceae bacterium]|nr:hypothetical protein [Pyrinomonadaceae bacterium]
MKRFRNVARDRENPDVYKKEGWKTLIIRECEIKDTVRLERKLKRFLIK